MRNAQNRLARETSPYLLQHARNPVDWYPWGDEAFRKAREEDKPIFLSIGYSSCHWCHVMERESFEDPETARLLNDLFVPIKVDREERPDVDAIYMSAVQVMTGQGGWPLSVFLTPGHAPFFGGTYFPPERRHGMASFREVLRAVAEAYRTQRDAVTRRTEILRQEVERLADLAAQGDWPGRASVAGAVADMRADYDIRFGGFGSAPKFPPSQGLRLLLIHHARTGSEDALRMATGTLRAMARGGIFDQAGGGFHRYSTDARWLVPHFEKMLYDNALLAEVYVEAYQRTRDAEFRRTAERTVDFLRREMMSPEGGFYTSLDADSEGEEGKFYVWEAAEVRRILGDEDFAIAAPVLGVTEEGKTILTIARDPAEAGGKLDAWLEKLREARERRVRPALDDKILTAWNGLAITAFARAGQALEDPRHVQTAARAARFILERARTDDGLRRSIGAGEARHAGIIEDYAFLARALLDLYEATSDRAWLDESLGLAREMIERFGDDEDGGFFYAQAGDASLWVRPKRFEDGPEPSGNAVAAEVCARLAQRTGDATLRDRAERAARATVGLILRYPRAMAATILVADLLESADV
ncbi:MAG: thioredoxin domain-containing protein [Planctomycetes bacterium]|nr:thioredoxin domain-containing protein [Planctomycetota bacterium]